VFDFLKEKGKAFHYVGAATENDLIPKDVNIFPRGKCTIPLKVSYVQLKFIEALKMLVGEF